MTPPTRQNRDRLTLRNSGMGLGFIALALIVGLQLGSFSWRYRKWIWRVQGLAFGAVAGYVAGKIENGGKENSK